MSLIRPEARATLWNWREVILAVAIGLMGLRWGLWSFGILQGLGWLLVLIACALGFAGIQRLRFRQGGGGAGVVTIDERRLVYFGPHSGGAQDLDTLARLDLMPRGQLAAQWVLTAENGEILSIPVDAEGADALFDLFVALPNIRTEPMLAALKENPDQTVNIWMSGQSETVRRLH
ncbi:hypothetical protein [Aestuariibius sp. HNIBRBA575]|uniref:hypothetical protein n=1 Tax=Aestuariibius sp. HNIBRBA575 TaxID=3233343 RepID=UPI0034A32B4D